MKLSQIIHMFILSFASSLFAVDHSEQTLVTLTSIGQTTQQSLTLLNTKQLAQQWGLTEEEWQQYELLKKGRLARRSAPKNIRPKTHKTYHQTSCWTTKDPLPLEHISSEISARIKLPYPELRLFSR